MYSERMLTGDLSPPITGTSVDAWSDQAPFIFNDHRPGWGLGLVLATRQMPSLGLLLAALGYALVCVMAELSSADHRLAWPTLMPGALLAGVSLLNMGAKRVLAYLDACPAPLARLSALKQRAADFDLRGPMLDAQARTGDCWRMGHVRQAQAVFDRMTKRGAESPAPGERPVNGERSAA